MKLPFIVIAAAAGILVSQTAQSETSQSGVAGVAGVTSIEGLPIAAAEVIAQQGSSDDVAFFFGRKKTRTSVTVAGNTGNSCEFTFDLRSGQRLQNSDETICLNFVPAEIRGIKLEDLNGNGVQDPEDTDPIAGITVNLYQDENGDGRLQDGSDSLVMSTTTAADGSYEFVDLRPGFYIVEEELSGGYLSNDETQFAVQLLSSDVFTDNDDTVFLNFMPAEIHGIKLLDVDGDGIVDPEDTTPISGVMFALYSDANGDGVLQDGEANAVQTVVTNDAGEWRFVDIVPGKYIVREER